MRRIAKESRIAILFDFRHQVQVPLNVCPAGGTLPFQGALEYERLQHRRQLGNLYSMQNREDDYQLPLARFGDGSTVRWQVVATLTFFH